MNKYIVAYQVKKMCKLAAIGDRHNHFVVLWLGADILVKIVVINIGGRVVKAVPAVKYYNNAIKNRFFEKKKKRIFL